MIQRRKRIERRTPLRRSTKRIARVGKRRKADLRLYGPGKKEFLTAHPLCQITLALLRIDEREILAAFSMWLMTAMGGDPFHFMFRGHKIPLSNQIHHRNKSNGSERFLDRTYWMAASGTGHQWAEDHKDEAREIGVLLPINARPDGSLPDGSKCLSTDELLRVRAEGEDS